MLSYEKEVLGVYLSGHPLDQYYDEWISTISAKSSDFIFIQGECHVKDGEKATIGGIITNINIKITKSKKAMAILILEDMLGSVEVVVFPQQYENLKSMLKEGEKYYLQGIIKQEDEKDAKLILEKAFLFGTLIASASKKELWIQFLNYSECQKKLKNVQDILEQYHGTEVVTVYLYLRMEKKVKKLKYRVKAENRQYIEALVAVCGSENVYAK